MVCGTKVEDRHDATHMSLLTKRYYSLTKKNQQNLAMCFVQMFNRENSKFIVQELVTPTMVDEQCHIQLD